MAQAGPASERPVGGPGGFPAAVRVLGAVPPPALVLLGIVSVQVGAALAKQLFALAGASGTVALRLGFAAVVLVLVWRPSVRIGGRMLLTVIGYGVVLGSMNLLFYQAIERIPLGAAVTIEFLGPLAVAVIGSRRWVDGLWALLAAGGVVLLTRSDGGLVWTGVLFALLAGVCWGSYILVAASLGSQSADGRGLALAMVFAALVVLPFGVDDLSAALLDPLVLLAGLGVALLSTVVPHSLELEALRRIPPRVFGILMSLEPAMAALVGLVVLGEALKPPQWVAVCLVVLASAGATRTARPV
ncbi:EamA family transporter [Umezawaea sp. Da 62-37]|uniref:EamA family transporter n=1 Tax=Umezawaea sp. Da 62-37 TaxID=3075927 RepID=UPI0028F734C4|nr:EamA family transporter [Umezawaea sp. Da 62-37]WNV92048.1 EamA family transporter [Umezawaea sp. Da 62-37]